MKKVHVVFVGSELVQDPKVLLAAPEFALAGLPRRHFFHVDLAFDDDAVADRLIAGDCATRAIIERDLSKKPVRRTSTLLRSSYSYEAVLLPQVQTTGAPALLAS